MGAQFVNVGEQTSHVRGFEGVLTNREPLPSSLRSACIFSSSPAAGLADAKIPAQSAASPIRIAQHPRLACPRISPRVQPWYSWRMVAPLVARGPFDAPFTLDPGLRERSIWLTKAPHNRK